MAVTLLAVPLVLYAAVLLLLRAAEPRLVYAPGASRTLTPPPPALGLVPERVEFRTADGVRLVGWVMRAAGDTAGRWLLMCHGNAGNLSDAGRPRHYAGLRGLGLSLLAFDYRGYGESSGAPDEAGLYRDADAAWGYLTQTLGVAPRRIVIFGHSLGSAVAVELATRAPAAGLILEGALTSVTDRAQEAYPLVPVRWMPKLFLHARADEVIPFAHGRRLFDAAPAPKTFVALAGGHGDAFERDSAAYFGAIARFLAALHTR
jgi:pimeloyl-ACP methyl ester carboxylesterase